MKKIMNVFFALLLVLTLAPKSHAVMGVTEVSIRGKKATVVLDGYLKISGIDVLKRGDRIKIKPPIYVSKSGKIFPQVDFKNSALKKRVISAIKTGKPIGSKSSRLSYKVSKMSLYNPRGKRSSMKAFSAVTFNNEIEIECKVMTGRKGPWISWPSTKSGRKWVKQVNIIKPAIKKKIEKSVLAKYEKETSYEAEIVPGGKSLPLTVTEVEVTPVKGAGSTKAIATIVLNNAIKISEIKVKKISGRTKLKWPAYVNKRGKVYKQIKILDPDFERMVVKAIEKKEPSSKTSSRISYKISKYSPFTRGG
ncbi:MAG: septation protein SpoVG family protein, partial [Elusimicrobiota bacterium]|nr:septation protein SpoVG family protein [Elusimicrobiota bacterium]